MKKMIRILLVATIVCVVALVLLGVFLGWSNKSIVVTEYDYSSQKVSEELDGYRIVHVSDLQSEYFGKEQINLLDAVRNSEPDIIVYTGDLIDRNHTDYEAARIAMEGLLSIAPVYFVNGNHDLAIPEEDVLRVERELREMGVNVLLGETKVINLGKDKIAISGLDERVMFEAKGFATKRDAKADGDIIESGLEKLGTEGGEDTLRILLAHEPQYLEVYSKFNYDLIFSGHAHGGQIRLPFTEGLYAPGQGIMPKLTSGMHESNGSTMVISRGLGNSVFPFRIFNRPEVVVLELKNGK